MGKLSKDRRDIYYRKAKEEGYRARSAYKLLQLDERFHLFEGARRVVDLCAAPGSWSQVIRNKLHGSTANGSSAAEAGDVPLIVAVDLQEMAPIEGVVQYQGDITAPDTVAAVLLEFGGKLADLVVCDGAPDVTGMHDIDEFIQSQLLQAALVITLQLLREGGSFVAKVFRGESIALVYSQLQIFFESVYCCKPAGSRNSSLEAFVVCQNFKQHQDISLDAFDAYNRDEMFVLTTPEVHDGNPTGEDSEVMFRRASGDPTTKEKAVPFVVCGDVHGFDSDRNYPLGDAPAAKDRGQTYKFKQPLQRPIGAPYDEAVSRKKGLGVGVSLQQQEQKAD